MIKRKAKRTPAWLSLYINFPERDLDTAGQLLKKIVDDAASIHQGDLGRYKIPGQGSPRQPVSDISASHRLLLTSSGHM